MPSDDLAAEPAETHARVLDFLGAAPHRLETYPRVYEREYQPMKPETRAWLAAEFEQPNRRLYGLLGRELGWS